MNPHQTDLPKQTIESIADGETKVGEIHKHPFGIIIVYLQAGLGLGLALGLMYYLLPQFVTDSNRTQLNSLLLLVTVVAVGITLLILFVASVVYRQSYLIVSDKNVTQVLQQSMFKRKVSELSMANIEDVTADQRGIFATLFNFGKLTIETAGEQNNFIFNYCPRPNYCGKMVLDVRQRYIESDPNRATRENNRLNLPPAPPPQYNVPPTPEPAAAPLATDQPPLPPQTSEPPSPEQTPPPPPPEQMPPATTTFN